MFFPGIYGLFRYGRWSFLAISLLFFLALDLLLVVLFFWTDCLASSERYAGVGAFLLLWFFLAQVSGYCEKMLLSRRDSDSKRNFFIDAQTQYLQGNWFEAECFLNEILKRNRRDPEALLMLATLYRHTERLEEGREVLRNLRNYDESRKWTIEIETELSRMKNEK